jgi:hypothetical protein
MERFTTTPEAARIKTAIDWVSTAIFTLLYVLFFSFLLSFHSFQPFQELLTSLEFLAWYSAKLSRVSTSPLNPSFAAP